MVKLQTSVQSRFSTFVGVSNLFVIHFREIGNLEPQAMICQIKSNLSFWLCKMPFFILLQQYSTRIMSKKGQVQETSTHEIEIKATHNNANNIHLDSPRVASQEACIWHIWKSGRSQSIIIHPRKPA